MRFRPCIDLRNGRVVQIVGGTLKDNEDGSTVTNFESEKSPAEFAELYKADRLTGGHVIALGPGNREAALSALRAYPGGLQIGGGINPENAGEYLDAGASHAIVTSYVFRDGKIDMDRLKEMVKAVGKQRLVLDLSCRKRDGEYYVVTDRWQKFTDFKVLGSSLKELSAYCDEYLVHGVDVEGLRAGIEDDLVRLLGEMSPIPVTYAGGARSIADLEKVENIGLSKVDLTIGSALDIFGGDTPYAEVVRWHNSRQ
ncbi:MAG: phosphoribosylformimino-5-aminoimidazole carboxamide ribotide isomerase [Planctomycetes bacterium]|nr:phosphoribosylformimino-5-aminoimidazole carboxamide ribotide isomerase [Planctomycetota bacterium]